MFALRPVVTAHLTPLLAFCRSVVTGTSFTVVLAVSDRCVNSAASLTAMSALADVASSAAATAKIMKRFTAPSSP